MSIQNQLNQIVPKLLANAVPTLQANVRYAQLATRMYSEEAGGRGSTIDVPIPTAVTVGDVQPTHNPLQPTPLTVTTVPIVMDQWKYAAFSLTDKQALEIMNGFFPMEAAEAVKSLCKEVDAYLAQLYKRFYNIVGTPGTAPFATGVDAMVDAKIMLDTYEAPDGDRVGVLDVVAQANALKLAAFRDTSQSGDNDIVRRGIIGEKYGFDWYGSPRVPRHVKGTATSITETSNSAVGATSVTLAVASGTGTLVQGDLIKFANHNQTYAVQAAVTLNTSGVSVTIDPPLKVAVNGSGTPVAVTLTDSHTANLAMHNTAIVLASRPMAGNNQIETPGVITDTIVDPLTQLTLRLQVVRQTFQTAWVFDVLYGGQVVRPELGVRIAGQ